MRDLTRFQMCDGLRFTGKSGTGYMLHAGAYSTGNGALLVECENGEAECVLTINMVEQNDALADDEFCVRLETIEFSEAPQALLDRGVFIDTGRRVNGPWGQPYAQIWRFRAVDPGALVIA